MLSETERKVILYSKETKQKTKTRTTSSSTTTTFEWETSRKEGGKRINVDCVREESEQNVPSLCIVRPQGATKSFRMWTARPTDRQYSSRGVLIRQDSSPFIPSKVGEINQYMNRKRRKERSGIWKAFPSQEMKNSKKSQRKESE